MGKRKVYMIVTNDDYETPIACDIVGAQACADYLGITIKMLWLRFKSDKWDGEYKAIDLGYETEIDEFEPNMNVTAISKEEREERVAQRKQRKHELSVLNEREKQNERYRNNRTRNIDRSKAYYQRHKEERKTYQRNRYMKIVNGIGD